MKNTKRGGKDNMNLEYCYDIKLHSSLNPRDYREHLYQYHNYDYPMEECLNEED